MTISVRGMHHLPAKISSPVREMTRDPWVVEPLEAEFPCLLQGGCGSNLPSRLLLTGWLSTLMFRSLSAVLVSSFAFIIFRRVGRTQPYTLSLIRTGTKATTFQKCSLRPRSLSTKCLNLLKQVAKSSWILAFLGKWNECIQKEREYFRKMTSLNLKIVFPSLLWSHIFFY